MSNDNHRITLYTNFYNIETNLKHPPTQYAHILQSNYLTTSCPNVSRNGVALVDSEGEFRQAQRTW